MLSPFVLIGLVSANGQASHRHEQAREVAVYYATCDKQGHSPAGESTIQNSYDITTAVKALMGDFLRVINSGRQHKAPGANLHSVWLEIVKPSGERLLIDSGNNVCRVKGGGSKAREYWSLTKGQADAIRHDILTSFPDNMPDGVGIAGLPRKLGGP